MHLHDLSDKTVKQERIDESMCKAKQIAVKAICDMYHKIDIDEDYEITSEDIDIIKDSVAILVTK